MGANTALGKGYSTHLKKKREKYVPSKLGRGKEMYLCQEYLPLVEDPVEFIQSNAYSYIALES